MPFAHTKKDQEFFLFLLLLKADDKLNMTSTRKHNHINVSLSTLNDKEKEMIDLNVLLMRVHGDFSSPLSLSLSRLEKEEKVCLSFFSKD